MRSSWGKKCQQVYCWTDQRFVWNVRIEEKARVQGMWGTPARSLKESVHLLNLNSNLKFLKSSYKTRKSFISSSPALVVASSPPPFSLLPPMNIFLFDDTGANLGKIRLYSGRHTVSCCLMGALNRHFITP